MATHAFIHFGDAIQGEADDAAHPNWCEISDCKWKVSNEVTPSKEGCDESGDQHSRGKIEELEIEKRIDSATPDLIRRCHAGQCLPEVRIDVLRPGYISTGDGNVSTDKSAFKWADSGPINYLRIELSNVVLKEYNLDMEAGEVAKETIKMIFNGIKITYVPVGKTDAVAQMGGQKVVELKGPAQ